MSPIYKCGSSDSIGNYRSVLNSLSIRSLSDACVTVRLLAYLNYYNVGLLYKHQYGFRQMYSTDQALVNVVDYILKALDSEMDVVGVFMDLSNAFDTMNHVILLDKFQHYGIRGINGNWLECYLTNRLHSFVYPLRQ